MKKSSLMGTYLKITHAKPFDFTLPLSILFVIFLNIKSIGLQSVTYIFLNQLALILLYAFLYLLNFAFIMYINYTLKKLSLFPILSPSNSFPSLEEIISLSFQKFYAYT